MATPKLDKRLFAAAVAQGINPKTVATWHPDLPRTPRVLVPIQVDALVVRSAGGVWADCRLRDPDPASETAATSAELLPEPFAELPQPRPAGVHLHWALPDGMTRGVGTVPAAGASATERAAAGATFPAIPDRWLVVRIGGGARGSLTRRGVTAWVIEADGRTPRATPLEAWTEAGAPDQRPEQPLTALGHGDLGWAAYYDNVTNRLAFYDDLRGITEGPLAYLVCGWYRDPALDVLGDSITSAAQFERRLAELGWELPPGSYAQTRSTMERAQAFGDAGLPTREATVMPLAKGSAPLAQEGPAQAAPIDFKGLPKDGYYRMVDQVWPKYTLCHGGVVGIGWPDDSLPGVGRSLLGGEVGGPPNPANIQVAIGHTLPDALAAMLCANNRTPAEARALEAALLGASDELDQADAAARIDSRVHAASFGSLPGGFVTETIQQTPVPSGANVHHPDPSKTDYGVFTDVRPQPKQGAAGGFGVKVERIAGGVRARQVGDAKLSGVKISAGAAMHEMFAAGAQAAPGGAPLATGPVQVRRALPRYFIPSDPVILLQGLNRSFKHGGDGRFSEKGRLPCRVSGQKVEGLSPAATRHLPNGGGFVGADILDRGIANGSVPPECDDLLHELAILDPGSAVFAARATARNGKRLDSETVTQAARAYMVEQTVWWTSRDPKRDLATLAAKSGYSGTFPCALAVSPPARPWVPLHLDWEVEYAPRDDLADWELKEIDFDARPERLPPAGSLTGSQTLRGRALLTAGATQTAAATVRQTLERAQRAGGSSALVPGSLEQFNSEMAKMLLLELSTMTTGSHTGASQAEAELKSVADALAEMDVLAGALDRFHTRLRGGYVADGVAAPGPDQAAPAPFVALRAGFLRIRRLRLVDCYGQVLDLVGSSTTTPADMTRVVRSEPMTVQDRPDLLELAPRFTAPTRLMFRFVAADDDAVEANDTRSPVCGFVLPDHLDAELQFHADNGAGLGAMRFDAANGVQWEDAPGSAATVGAAPKDAITNPHLAGIAQGLLDWGVADTTRTDPANDTALSALLRIIDTSLWSVDPYGHVGDEHLSLLVGHPLAVMRAKLTLEIDETIAADALQLHRVPVRIGALAQWQDGLLGYFVDDDYRTLHLPDPAAANLARPIGPGQGFLQNITQTSEYYRHFAEDLGVSAVSGASPVDHDFVDTSGVIWLRPGQTVMLTLMMEPLSVVHATAGLVPRKAIGMRREWVNGGLANIAPTFRFGPVLVDPKRIRMPLASEIHGSWTWCHRVDATTWQEDEVINATGDGQLPRDPVEGQEGWLKLTPEKTTAGGSA